MKFRITVVLVALLILAVVAAVPAPASSAGVAGLVAVESQRSFDDTVESLIAAVEAEGGPSLVAVIDHAAAAASVELDLAPTTLVVFGAPALGTPVMQDVRGAGIDLPQKMLVWENRGRVFVGYNAVDYLNARHGLGDVATLAVIEGALRNFAAVAAGVSASDIDDSTSRLARVRTRPGLVTVDSALGFAETAAAVRVAIDASPASVIFEVDHAANAAAAGLELPPTTLIVFGSPQLGTPFMQKAQTSGIDLPLKFLVWEDADGVHLTYTEIEYMAARHGASGLAGLVDTISAALAGLAEAGMAGP